MHDVVSHVVEFAVTQIFSLGSYWNETHFIFHYKKDFER